MKRNTISVIVPIALILSFSVAFAMSHKAEERGKALFENPNFAGGKKACNSCHPKGKGLLNAGSKSEFSIMEKKQNSLEEAINFCIVNANKGKAIVEDSKEMQEMVSFIKSLGPKGSAGYGTPGYGGKAPGYGAPGYGEKAKEAVPGYGGKAPGYGGKK
jgi:cytochrome c